MDTHRDSSGAKVNPKARWGFTPPKLPTLPAEFMADFFANAPVGSVVEIYGDLYSRSYGGDWLHLEELTSTGGYYSSMEYNRSNPEDMMRLGYGSYAPVRVVRLGEAESA